MLILARNPFDSTSTTTDTATQNTKEIPEEEDDSEHSSFSDLSLGGESGNNSPAESPDKNTPKKTPGKKTASAMKDRLALFNDLKKQIGEKDVLIQQYELNAKSTNLGCCRLLFM